jgi:hypothetical protein
VVRLDQNGKQVWGFFKGTKVNERYQGVAIIGSGPQARIAVVGSQESLGLNDNQSGLLAVFDDKGAIVAGSGGPLDLALNEKPNTQEWLLAAPRMPDGSAVAVGLSTAVLYAGGWWHRIGADGEPGAHGAIYAGFNCPLWAVAADHDGGVTAAGAESFSHPYVAPWTVHIDANGTVAWSDVNHSLDDGLGPRGFFGLSRMADGSLLGVGAVGGIKGQAASYAARQPWVAHLSRFGHYPDADVFGGVQAGVCETTRCDSFRGAVALSAIGACDDLNECTIADMCSGGECRQYQTNPCDDENPCTFDLCQSQASGCTHESTGDGSACTSTDQCESGHCGACNLVEGTAGTQVYTTALAVAPVAAGGWWLAGFARPSGQAQVVQDNGWAARLGPDGKVTAQVDLDVPGIDDRLNGVVAASDGGAWLQGYTIPANWNQPTEDRDLRTVRLDPAGKIISQTTISGAGRTAAYGVLAKGAGWVALGEAAGGAWAAGFDGAGKQVWQTAVAPSHSWLGSALALPDGSLVVGGSVNGTPQYAGELAGAPLAARVDPQHAVAWVVSKAMTAFLGVVVGLAPSTGGTTVAVVADFSVGGNWDATFYALDGAGKVVWKHETGWPGQQLPHAAVALPDGGWLTLGQASTAAGTWGAHVMRFDAKGKRLWDEALSDGETIFYAALPAVNGLVTAVGSYDPPGKTTPTQLAWLRQVGVDGKLWCGPKP